MKVKEHSRSVHKRKKTSTSIGDFYKSDILYELALPQLHLPKLHGFIENSSKP